MEDNRLPNLEKAHRHQSLYSRAHALIPPSSFLPGRLSNIEILERIFPFQRKSVLELVLQGCNGDLVKAIEQFLSNQETLLSQNTSSKSDYRPHPYLGGLSYGSSLKAMSGLHKLPHGSNGSAFTPFSSPSIFPHSGLHSAFSPNLSSLTTDPLRSHMFTGSLCNSNLYQNSAHLPYPRLGSLTSAPLPGFLSNPFPVSYRHGLNDEFYRKSPEKHVNSENEHAQDTWDDVPKDRDT